MYVFDMTISIHLQANGPATYTAVILDDVLIPRVPCRHDSDFKIPGIWNTSRHICIIYLNHFSTCATYLYRYI